ncbi:MAG: 50S ribosomal protein L25 [Candidatus Dojkabacteria bacterium]
MKLVAQKREVTGRKVKNLREEGIVPASVYGPKKKSENIQIKRTDFSKAFKAVGFNKFLDLEIEGGKTTKVLIKSMFVKPISDKLLDVSFYQVDEESKITVDVPIQFLGEAPAVKQNVGFLITAMDAVQLYCLPRDLPDHLEVDISKLENIGDGVTVHDLVLPEGVEFDSSVGENATIVNIAAPQKEIVEEVVAEVEYELDAEGNQKLDAEGNPIPKAVVVEGAEAEGDKKEEK